MFQANGLESQTSAAGARRPPSYLGPERRLTPRSPGHWLLHMLDLIDYGMLLVGDDAELRYLNHAARVELAGKHPLQLVGRRLRAERLQDADPLQQSLAAARRGLRGLVTLGEGEHRVTISVVPLAGEPGDDGGATLLLLGKRQVCEQLSVRGYARSHGLTPAETRVLEALCGGVGPADIAAQAKVKVSTVRTQIGSIRAKTGTVSIRELVRQVAVLPPLVSALRGIGGIAGGAAGSSPLQ